jgi:hypothetical protein
MTPTRASFVFARKGPQLQRVPLRPLTPIAIAAYEKLAPGKKPGDLLCSKIKGGDSQDPGTGSTPA